MRSLRTLIVIALWTCFCVVIGGRARAQGAPMPVGIFEGHSDVGAVLHPGSVDYDASAKSYTISGSGENMWFATDAFQFAWKKVSGDVTLTADISFIGSGGEGHRKAVLMIRQSLDADSPYADIARHGDGLTSLQARDEKGVNTTARLSIYGTALFAGGAFTMRCLEGGLYRGHRLSRSARSVTP